MSQRKSTWRRPLRKAMIETGLGENILLRVVVLVVLVSTVILITRLALAVRLLELSVVITIALDDIRVRSLALAFAGRVRNLDVDVILTIALDDVRIQSLALAFAGGVRNLGGSHCRCYAVMYRVIAHTESLTMERPSASVRMRTRKA